MESPFVQKALKLGLQLGTINNIQKSPPVKELFIQVVDWSGLTNAEKKVGNLLYAAATKLPSTLEAHRKLVAELVGSGKITNSSQFDVVVDYLKKSNSSGTQFDVSDFNEKCGIGKNLTNEEITKVVHKVFEDNKTKFEEGVKKSSVLDEIKKIIPYVQFLSIKEVFDKTWEEKGYKQPAKEVSKAPKKQVKAEAKQQQQDKPSRDITELVGREMSSLVNSKQLLEKHQKQFGKGIYTRFPPEPNGYLHIGHAKAMRFNFTLAKHYGGHCYLRYDDTNPEKQCQQFIDNIEENINFLGYKPWKITHASDLFQKLYEFAITLIKKGKAFVCGQTIQQARKKRSEGLPSQDRDRPVEQNLRMFENMRLGLYSQGQYCLRAKIDPAHPNTTLRDPVLYRIRYTAHPHTKDKWCIYPLYDYTHPLCDSLEGITHSLCTLEFEIRRELYYWPLEQLNLYRPYVWEYSRLNISNTVLSKRKLHHLIFNNYVNGWDDPRVLTLNGMKRRGYTAQAINNFCDVVGVTRRGNQNIIGMNVLENQVRKVLDISAPRTMAVIDPVILIIENLKQPEVKQIPDFPKDPNGAKHKVINDGSLYVDRSDVREVDSPTFYGIAPGKRVGLKYSYIVLIKSIETDQKGKITKVISVIDEDQTTKVKSYIHWISANESVQCQVRWYNSLFTVNNPNQQDDFLKKLNPESVVIYQNSLFNVNLLPNLKHLDRFQFQRKGFFAVDYDSNVESKKIVWNLTVSLLQDKDKGDQKPKQATKKENPKKKKQVEDKK